MGKVITISNHKGGVGKTTSTINIGAGLNRMKKRVLLIDLDPQANLTQSLQIPPTDQAHDIYGAMTGRHRLRPVQVVKDLDVIPSTLDLSGAETELSNEAGREYILKELVDAVRSKYDYIIIDSPPSLGLLTVNALTASDSIMIPIQAEYLALQGIAKLTEIVEKIKKRLNKKLQLGGVFITQYDNRRILNRDIGETLHELFGKKIFMTVIRDNIALAEAPAKGMDIFRYDARSHGAQDYTRLCKEIIKL